LCVIRIKGCARLEDRVFTSFWFYRFGAGSTLGKKIVMGKLLGLLLGALAIGVVIGVVFELTYPNTEISPELGLLFALLGLILSLLVRAGWHALVGREG
jgi:hypothetical protein